MNDAPDHNDEKAPEPAPESAPAPASRSDRSYSGMKTVTYTYSYEPAEPKARVEHDREKRRSQVSGPDGTTVEFHDRPVRFLVVEPDPESKTGEIRPVLSR